MSQQLSIREVHCCCFLNNKVIRYIAHVETEEDFHKNSGNLRIT
jgi:hypothetical protein